MTSMDELIHEIDPTVIARARRLQVAIQLLTEGKSRAAAAALIRQRFEVTRWTAWRVVSIAWDMAGEVKK